MFHKFFEEGYWFEPKSHGYGSGMPVAWQGWVLLTAYIALVVGLAVLAGESNNIALVSAAIAVIVIATVMFAMIVRNRTRGGWRWRWGRKD